MRPFAPIAMLAVLLVCTPAPLRAAEEKVQIDAAFPGGNIVVDKIDGHIRTFDELEAWARLSSVPQISGPR